MSRKISIDPITRLEGHGKIEIFLDDTGAVQDCYFQIPELRGFERFVVGRPIEELPRLVTRICGVCPASHHMASAKAVDGCFGGEVAPLAIKLRRMYYNAHYIHSHIAHFYALAAPDFVLGPDADPAIRNVLGVVAKVGLEIGGAVIASRGKAQEIQRIIGGRSTQDIWCIPGGVAKGLKPDELEQIRPMVAELYEFTQFSLQLFRDIVLANPTYLDIIANGPYTLDVQNMGLVDEHNAPDFYDGQVRVVDFEGTEICRYEAHQYADYVAEHVEPWSYLKFPLPQAARLEGVRGGHRQFHLLRHAARPAQRRRPHGHAPRPGGLRGDVRGARRAPQPHAPRPALGAARGDGAERRGAADVLRRPRDHRRRRTASSPSRSPARASASSRPCAAR